ncbi:hypothetical protein WN55_07405 [Dufourea novaeangliae]|uniref:Uncharacterized protein n=1 Tax=Dufourea novaeangliae TaxID=178035 RepID=A0A154PTY9_DUFNO|nr:hypothetical protein WN55_07405 [Dufourea novaeangliae]
MLASWISNAAFSMTPREPQRERVIPCYESLRIKIPTVSNEYLCESVPVDYP